MRAQAEAPRLVDADLTQRISREAYEERLEALRLRLLTIQQAYLRSGDNAVIVLEGWDAAGKGGAIRRLSQAFDPRALKVWPIAAPRPYDQVRHYLARFWNKLPADGTVAVFDRSWYGRVLVERVEGFASETEWRRAFDEINSFEKMLTDDGTRIIKLFLHISAEEQLERFAARFNTPSKRWKLTQDDFRNRDKRGAYVAAIDEMFERTHTSQAPWVVIPAEQKKFARVKVIETIADRLAAGVDLAPPPLDNELADIAQKHFGPAGLSERT
ncbi:MAG: polyphosphate kinase 2 [Neomegalonema sp.]|nr:polyphosphate kinase 2 [Neomegalonema sp.]